MMRLGQYHRRHPDLRGVFSVLVPYSWFQILWYFYIYGFLGWCSEVAFAAVAHGKFVNRGFVNGPICSIYGFGVMSVLLVLGPLKSSFWLLFGGSVLFTSAIEYLTGWVLEKVFHDKWWDYSKRPLNIKGYVCLEFSVLWGLACVFVVDVFQPLVAKVVDLIPKKLGWALLGMFSVLWITDNIITAMEIRKLPKKLRALQAIEDSLTAISDEIGEEIYIRASDAKDRSMEVYTTEPGVQVYTANWHNGFEGAHGATFPARSAICFEAQCFPDTPNKPHFPSATLLPGDEYQQITIYKFSVEE